ncbi:long-chain fatty acid transport protein [Nitrosomonas sp. Nm51]|uniref:OmpP1/FadL family transporter n=1 Tax=Nitrosomonas sp. Nm51 TaxID=133720 RepID=UPI0008B9D5A4|nr:outer membrane protein transport protein [Nitrosomonas sp. Nm51]SER75949.1 long-chain fatty acid transport protein [Nitrosomonas sp. Nm51]
MLEFYRNNPGYNRILEKTIKLNIIRIAQGNRFYCLCCLLFYLSPASGAGIATMESSVKELGQAFSGAPTNIEDGSMVFFNPGAMNHVRGGLFSFAGYAVIPSVRFKNTASQLSPQVGGSPLRGNDGGDSPHTVLIPNFYYVQNLSERFAVGLGINIPFGMESSYHPDWKGRYQAIDSKLVTINFNPSASMKITEKLSVGAGLNVQYLESRLTNAIDFGMVCLNAANPSACASQGLMPQTADGHVSLKGDSVGFGYNIGIFYKPTENTRFGASYRSKVQHNIRGNADFTVPENARLLTQGHVFVDTSAKTPVTLPDNVLFGFFHQFNAAWALSADALWTRWSRIRELRTHFSSLQPDDVQTMKWKDTWRFAFGLRYSPIINKLTLRTGFSYDESPVSSPLHRSPRIPDNDRYWLTAGATYAVLKNIDVHVAYAHLFINDTSINRTGSTGDQLTGKFTEHINIVGLQLDWRF